MALKITRPQGTEDITPENISKWYTVEQVARDTAIGISILMIGAACVYAYQVTMETNQTLENELSQTAEETQPTTNFIAEIYDAVTTTQPEYDAVAKVKTDVPVETTTEAVEETEPQEEPEPEPEETEEVI
jgi:hypothetical protein